MAYWVSKFSPWLLAATCSCDTEPTNAKERPIHIQWDVVLYGALIIIAGVLVIVFRRAILRVTGFAATTFYGRLGRRVARTQPVYMIIAGSLTVALGLVVVILGVLLPPYPG